jgi:hypothetical protein
MQHVPQTAIGAARAAEGLRRELDGPAAQGAVEVDAPCDRRHPPLLTIGQRLGFDDRVLLVPWHAAEDGR